MLLVIQISNLLHAMPARGMERMKFAAIMGAVRSALEKWLAQELRIGSEHLFDSIDMTQRCQMPVGLAFSVTSVLV
jgi:hypothetical protein